jgi:Skp family chaperone for outer membrane proteins
MPKKTALLLIAWNVLLTALAALALMRGNGGGHTSQAPAPDSSGTAPLVTVRDSGALANARIAFFFVDSLRERLEFLKERRKAFASEESRMQARVEREMERAQQRSRELLAKDHTYSTKAELDADQRELMKLESDMRRLASESEEHLVRMGERALMEFSRELQGFLEEYNKAAGFDYIISIEPGGQVWVGNKELDITADIIAGMNRRHAEAKAAGGK